MTKHIINSIPASHITHSHLLSVILYLFAINYNTIRTPEPNMEITVISAQGLKKTTSGPFSHRLRPFITITTYPPTPCNSDKQRQVYRTRVDDQGGVNPTWGDKFYVPIDFFSSQNSCIYLQLYTKRLILGHFQLGWCPIPITDVLFLPEGSVRYLSYRIRDRDGSKGHGVVNLAIKFTGFQEVAGLGVPQASDECQTVIGIPVTAFSHTRHL